MSTRVTNQDIQAARSVDLVAFLQARGYELKIVGNQYCLAEHNSLFISGNMWNWFSQGKGGNSVDFLVHYEGMSFIDAVNELLGSKASQRSFSENHLAQSHSEPKEFTLPEPAGDNRRAFGYLCGKRGISRKVLNAAISNGSVYQNAKGGVTFVGFNPEGEAKYAMSRSTYDSGKYESAGSSKRYGFTIPCPGSESLTVFESAIDAMSHASLYPRLSTHRLSLGGVSALTLEEFLANHPEIKFININLDADERGIQATESLKKLLNDSFPGRYKVYVHQPLKGCKDWNEALVKRKREEKSR